MEIKKWVLNFPPKYFNKIEALRKMLRMMLFSVHETSQAQFTISAFWISICNIDNFLDKFKVTCLCLTNTTDKSSTFHITSFEFPVVVFQLLFEIFTRPANLTQRNMSANILVPASVICELKPKLPLSRVSFISIYKFD